MSFKRLSQEDLQMAIGPEILKRLEALAPILGIDGGDIVTIYLKKNLVKLLESFGTANLMKDKPFFNSYLSSLPPEDVFSICRETSICDDDGDYDTCVGALSKKGWRSPEYCKIFSEVVGLPPEVIPVICKKIEKVEIIEGPSIPFKQLMDFQFSTMLRCQQILSKPRARLVLQMPTGSGKTRTAMELVSQHLNEVPHARVLWMAHSEELCEQAIECLRETWNHLGKYDLKFGRVFGGCHAFPDHEGKEVLVGSFQSLYAMKKSNTLWSKESYPVSLIVIDEAHKVLAPTYKEVTRHLISSLTKVLGLTATPGRGIEDDFGNAELSNFFFNTIVPLEGPSGENAIEFLKNRQVLANAKQEVLNVPIEFELTDQEKSDLEEMLDYPAGLLKRIGGDDVRNLEILKKLKDTLSVGKQCLFFACSVDHSKFICALLNYMGISARHVDGSTERSERRSIVASFKNKETQVLCNYGVLATGFDAPKVDIVFISRPTKSIVLYSQMIGRGLRGPRVGGTESCTIVNVQDNFLGMPSNSEIFEYFEDYWT